MGYTDLPGLEHRYDVAMTGHNKSHRWLRVGWCKINARSSTTDDQDGELVFQDLLAMSADDRFCGVALFFTQEPGPV
jgi:hypothetical protein